MWGIITVQMLNLGFPFKPRMSIFTLTAIAGISWCATMRIPASFLIRMSGWSQYHLS
jgi:NNP family nitrate/nitrite transporter-like MFS transporter